MKKRSLLIFFVILLILPSTLAFSFNDFLNNFLTSFTTAEDVGCEDSDGGLNYYEKGNIRVRIKGGGLLTGKDRCSSINNNLIEWYCDGNTSRITTFTCENGCWDGTCNNISIIKTPEEREPEFSEPFVISRSKLPKIECKESECLYNNTCLEVGERIVGYANRRFYCSSDYNIYNQKTIGSVCVESYECLTDICRNNICSTEVPVEPKIPEEPEKECPKGKCPYEDSCIRKGARVTTADDENLYCFVWPTTKKGEMHHQKEVGSQCIKNYECLSNRCKGGKTKGHAFKYGRCIEREENKFIATFIDIVNSVEDSL